MSFGVGSIIDLYLEEYSLANVLNFATVFSSFLPMYNIGEAGERLVEIDDVKSLKSNSVYVEEELEKFNNMLIKGLIDEADYQVKKRNC